MSLRYEFGWLDSPAPNWWKNFSAHIIQQWGQSSSTATIMNVIDRELPPGFKFEFANDGDREVLIAPSESEMMMFILKWS